MKPTAVLLNTSRGEIVDEAALCAALREKRIAGAGLDVYHQEPIAPENSLLKLENVILTPAWEMSLEEYIAYINDDELVEVTPKSVRLRKREVRKWYGPMTSG